MNVLSIRRGTDSLRVTARADGFDLAVSSGGNVTQAEYEQIVAFVGDNPAAMAFLEKVRRRMERT